MTAESKDPAQKRIEHLTYAIWILLCLGGLLMFGTMFALGVFLGGAICILNFQWLYSHAKKAISLRDNQGTSFMKKRYIIRLITTGIILYALIGVLHIDVLGLLLGLSVVMLGIMSYACYIYIIAGGE
ncbi:MAG TPA: ATP synthase subunit I [Deltaproteobacteria bacterium]|nr:ATP synthase subunit I [Deltaproteobacteria bacterium]